LCGRPDSVAAQPLGIALTLVIYIVLADAAPELLHPAVVFVKEDKFAILARRHVAALPVAGVVGNEGPDVI